MLEIHVKSYGSLYYSVAPSFKRSIPFQPLILVVYTTMGYRLINSETNLLTTLFYIQGEYLLYNLMYRHYLIVGVVDIFVDIAEAYLLYIDYHGFFVYYLRYDYYSSFIGTYKVAI